LAHFRILALAALVFLTASSATAADGRTVFADRILEQIAAGEPVEYDGYTIEGALDLDRLTNLPTVEEGLFYQVNHTNLSGQKKAIASRIRIANSTIKGWVNFNNTIFSTPVDFKNTSFEGHAGFRGAVFKKGTDLSGSQFSKYADFLGSEIPNHAYFNNSRFHDYADFEGAYFDYANFNASFTDIADFKYAHFNGDAYFGGTGFNDIADFGTAGFNGYADFGFAGFNDTADFRGAGFNGTANFVGAGFSGTVGFLGTRFNDTAYFSGVEFNGTTKFDGVKFNGDADFEGAEFNRGASFSSAEFNSTDFTKSQFDKEAHFEDADFIGKTSFENAHFKEDALFENASFEDELNLIRTRYSKLFIRWHSIEKGGLAYDDAAYMSLMKNFKELGYYEDYDGCYYAYRKAHRSEDWPSVPDWEEAIRKFIDYPLEWFYGYGTKPFHAFFWSLGIVLAFFFYWRWLGLGGPQDKTKESLKDGEEWLDGDLTDILGYSVTVFLSGTRFFIDPPALPKIDGRSRSWMKKAFILERALGMLFSVLFFIAISGTIVRAA
jgi:uncharacterized protein YjbI with pentapeptide repeats